jgi:ribosome-associated protein
MSPNKSMATATDIPTTAILRTLVAALEDKKAEQLKVMNVGGLSDITDYLVLATGNSEPHLRALRIEAEKVFDAAKLPIAGTEQGGYGSGWTVMDAYQIMVHFFTAEQRENYALDKLWKDAAEIDLKTMAAKAAAPAKPKAPKTSKPAGSKPAAGGKGAKPKAVKTGAKAAGASKKAVVKPAAKTKPAATSEKSPKVRAAKKPAKR